MRKLVFLLSLALGCTTQTYNHQHKPEIPAIILTTSAITQSQHQTQQTTQQPQQKISYTLEDLCDTEITEKKLDLQVYIQPSEIIWDYHEFKEELFEHIIKFFQKEKISCRVTYASLPFVPFNESNKFGVEIYDSEQSFKARLSELLPQVNTDNEGYAITKKGIALHNAGWQEWRGNIGRQEVEAQFHDNYQGLTVKQYHLRQNAKHICHEILHNLSLFHPNTFSPALVETYSFQIPNIMSYQSPKFSDEFVLGSTLADLQRKLIHSFLAGNNTYQAFQDSNRDLDIFLGNIAKANNLIKLN